MRTDGNLLLLSPDSRGYFAPLISFLLFEANNQSVTPPGDMQLTQAQLCALARSCGLLPSGVSQEQAAVTWPRCLFVFLPTFLFLFLTWLSSEALPLPHLLPGAERGQ